MRILATITKATTGTVTWNGTDITKSPDNLRAVLGYLPQDFGVYPNLNAVDFFGANGSGNIGFYLPLSLTLILAAFIGRARQLQN